MGVTHLDRFAGQPSWLTQRTTPTQRLWIAIAAAFAAGLMPPGAWRALALLALIVAIGTRAGRVPPGVLIRRLAQAAPFFLLPALALPFSVPGPTAFEVGPLTASTPGLARAAEIALRATVAVTAVTAVVSVTRAVDLLNALADLPLPRLVTTALALGYRYLYVLNDEHERSSRALRSRAGRIPMPRLWRARGAMLAHLFTRAHSRAGRIQAAMSSRGYRERLPTLQAASAGHPAWTAFIVATLTAVWLGGLIEVL